MNDYRELEFKYNANNIDLIKFMQLMEEIGYVKTIDASSWDVYYYNENNSTFLRHRLSNENPELTVKIKIKQTNNHDRIELDLPLNAKLATEDLVKNWCLANGYEKDFKIYKSCFIYWFNEVNCVYYIVYNENMTELDRYIEIEYDKNLIQENTEHSFTLPISNNIKQLEGGLHIIEYERNTIPNVKFDPIDNAFNRLKQFETHLEKIGITYKNRLNKSLMETYTRKGK